jgi:hypothetical protein
MASIEIIVRDNKGNILRQSQPEVIDLGGQSLHEIEGAVETWRQKVLPELESDLLTQAQTEYTQSQKNKKT